MQSGDQVLSLASVFVSLPGSQKHFQCSQYGKDKVTRTESAACRQKCENINSVDLSPDDHGETMEMEAEK